VDQIYVLEADHLVRNTSAFQTLKHNLQAEFYSGDVISDMDFIVGTFNHNVLYTLHFEPPSGIDNASLSIVCDNPAISGHSWLSFSKNKKVLYCTAWTKPNPSIASYSVKRGGRELQFLNAKQVKALSGYVCANDRYVFSVGGPTGEVFLIEGDGSIGPLIQELDFVTGQGENMSEKRGEVAHGSFGGLRHGSHSVDLSPDGRSLYVADIGRNCIWTYSIKKTKDLTVTPLELGSKYISPRSHDGPRHTWPHPNGKILYCLQEHSSMVDVFAIGEDGTALEHKQGVKIIPADNDPKHYWADEVRLSTGPDPEKPRYMYASTRGLESHTKGYVAVFPLNADGTLDSETAIDIWETPTSGGLANAIEPAPWRKGQNEDEEFLAMTDSEEGLVFILSFDGKNVKEAARLSLGKTDDGDVVGAATAVWLGVEGGGIRFQK
jgi:carboxy-cis,cis-muconate cyclase